MSPPDDTPGLPFPPPLIFLGGLALGWAIDLATGWKLPSSPWIGIVVTVAGAALMLAASLRFWAARTPLVPWKPTTGLVTTGVFRLSRNPVYIGMAVVQAGLALVIASPSALAAAAVALVIVDRLIVPREERYLAARFNEDWIAWSSRVRRWL